MNAHTSLGSQPQYRPQDASAQIAPEMMANVQIGNANACSLKVSRSSPSAAGTRAPSGYGNRLFPSSWPARTRYIAAVTNPVRNAPNATTAEPTWMKNQYESSGALSGPTGV